LVQENHYMPFGLGMRGLDWVLNAGKENKFQYNGGVEKNTDFDLNWYETFYRNLDVQTGRFVQVDPLAEDGNQENLTPYHYAYNNPIRYNDPKGDCPNGDCWEMLKEGAKAVVETTVEFANGFANAVAYNNTNVVDVNGNVVLSGVQRQKPISFAHQAGQQAGDLASMAQGAVEIAAGGIIGTGGVAITVGSVGTLTVVGAPAAVAGAGIIVHGGNTAKNALNNLMNQSGRVNASPNNGNSPNHGKTNHNNKIDNLINKVKQDPANINIRKNQEQHDNSGNKVGTNRPDVQWDNTNTGKHYNVEYDTKKGASQKHKQQVTNNDPNAVNKFWIIK
jgi:RHS repeat-associated protein